MSELSIENIEPENNLLIRHYKTRVAERKETHCRHKYAHMKHPN